MKTKRLGVLMSTLATALASMALIASAAQATSTAPGYEEFAGCPSPAENSAIVACFRSVVESGHFQMGSKDVPITNPMTLSGGYTSEAKFFANSKGGLTPVRQTVPGGIVGLTGLDWLVNFLNLEGLKLYAVTELAGSPGNPLANPLTLPIKVHLENPVLGNNCYVGSNTEPIQLNLTFNTTSPPPPNKPISGKEPTREPDPKLLGVLRLSNGTLVDNAFAAPAAHGCQLNLGLIHIGIDELVNLQSGLPSPAGTNETVQNVNGAIVESRFVYP